MLFTFCTTSSRPSRVEILRHDSQDSEHENVNSCNVTEFGKRDEGTGQRVAGDRNFTCVIT